MRWPVNRFSAAQERVGPDVAKKDRYCSPPVICLVLSCHVLLSLNCSIVSVTLNDRLLAVASLWQTELARRHHDDSWIRHSKQSESFVECLYSNAEAVCLKCMIEPKPVQRRMRKLPSHLSQSVVTQPVGHRAEISSATAFRQHCYLPVIDCIIAELEARFSDSSSIVMTGIQALTPNHPSFLDSQKIVAFAQLYKSNIEDISHEVYQLKRLLQRAEQNKLSSLLELACFLEVYKLAFQEVYRLCSIALVLPVTSAACERSFSALKLIKSYLRSTMCDSRLSSLAILSIESCRSQSINFDSFVDEFDGRHNNRKLALH